MYIFKWPSVQWVQGLWGDREGGKSASHSQTWSHTHAVSTLRRQRHEGCLEFEAILGYIVNLRQAWAT